LLAYARSVTVITWLTPSLSETTARFRDRLGFQVEEPPFDSTDGGVPDSAAGNVPRATIRLANAVIDVVESAGRAEIVPGDAMRPAAMPGFRPAVVPGERLGDVVRSDRLEDDAPRPVHPNGAAGLLAVGWSTVDHERAASSRSGVRFVFAGLDPLLGSAAWLATALSPSPSSSGAAPGRSAGTARSPSSRAASAKDPPNELLLEPAREGPLAAALARFGEGPVAIYVRVLPGRWQELHGELTRRGATLRGPVTSSFGEAYLVRPERPWGPFLVFVRVPSAGGGEGSRGPASA
jgi:hypothetical protein